MRKFLLLLLLSTLLIFPLYSLLNDQTTSLIELQMKTEYKALTYNIHRGTTKHGVSSLKEIENIIKGADPDFVALQEVDRYNIRSGFEDQIKTLSNNLNMKYKFGSNMNFMLTEYGNALLSKYPIIDWGQIPLSKETEPRSILWAKVQTKTGILYITSIHLGLDKKLRSKHFSDIEKFVNSLDGPVLIMGDFNTRPNNQLFHQFRTRISDKFVIHQEIPTYVNKIPIQIDYIFGKNIKEIETYNIPSSASDHYPLILKFKFSDFPLNYLKVTKI